ncbi:SIR2 family protein [Clostridium paridis]|nr:SIR2 family protein [Clostridium paridis]
MKNKINEKGVPPIFFIGAGISRRYIESPTWEELLMQIASTTDCNYYELKNNVNNNFERLAQEIEYFVFRSLMSSEIINEDRRFFMRNNIADILKKCFESQRNSLVVNNEIVKLKKTRPAAIVTTNYDELLEHIFGDDYSVHIGQDSVLNKNVLGVGDIYKIHGCVTDPSSILITKEDYDNFFEKSKYLYAKLLTIFWEYPLIFMGYSISDRNILDILTIMTEIMSKDEINSFTERIWLLDYSSSSEDVSVEMKNITLLNGRVISVTCFKLYDYGVFYEAISDITSKKLPVKFLKFLKKNLYEVCTYNEYNKQLLDVNIKNINDIDEFTEENTYIGITTKNEKEDLKFQISEEVIELLIEPLYKQQDKKKVVVRELLQNSLDACKKVRNKVKYEINIYYLKEEDKHYLKIVDNGIGMNFNEIKENYLTIGKSSKKDTREGLVGKYGIGALSMFLVGDNVDIITKKSYEDMIHFKLFIKDGKKQVIMLENNSKETSINSFTEIKIQLNDNWNCSNVNEFISKIGLDNYITNKNFEIKITYDKESTILKNIESKLDEWFDIVTDNVYLINEDKMNEKTQEGNKSDEDKVLYNIFKQKNIVFYNDMISNVIYEKDNYKQLGNYSIPFLIINGKLESMGLETELSRNTIKISHKIVESIAVKIYESEIIKLINFLVDEKENYQLIELKKIIKNKFTLINNNCDILFYNNKLALTCSQSCYHIEIWSNHFTDFQFETDYKYLIEQYIMDKKSIADQIENESIICISVKYLYDYIINATGSRNGLRQKALLMILKHILPEEHWYKDTNADIWSNVMSRKSDIKDACNQNNYNGLIFLKDEYRMLFNKLYNKSYNQYYIIAFKNKHVEKNIDNNFSNILSRYLEENKEIQGILEII